jgi:Dolichyl-phosphate-mannose-protein mannosyltransferase
MVRRHERWLGLALLAAATVAYLCGALLWASKTPLTTDEVFVMWVLRFFPVSGMASAISAGADSLPPGYFYLLKGVSGLIGLSNLAIRMPSIVAFYVFAVATYAVCRRRAGILTSAFAAACVCLTGAAQSATIARPYAIVCACFGVAVWLWLKSDESGGQKWRSAGIACALAMAVFVHFYAVLLAVSIGLMEALWTMRERRVRWRNWAAIFAGGISVLMWWPVIGPIYRFTHAPTTALGFYARPTVAALLLKYVSMIFTGPIAFLGVLLILVAAIISAAAPKNAWKSNASRPSAPNGFDIALCVAAILPVVTFLFALLVTRSFNTRYFFAAAMALGMFVSRLIGRRQFAESISACFLMLAAGLFVTHLLSAATHTDPRLEVVSRAPGSLPIVVGDASDFFVLVESASKAERERLVFVGMPPGASSPDPEPEMVAVRWKKLRPDLAVFGADQFLAGRCSFYVLDTQSQREGMTDWLRRNRTLRAVWEVGRIRLLEADNPACAARASGHQLLFDAAHFVFHRLFAVGTSSKSHGS